MTKIVVFEGLSPWIFPVPKYVQNGLIEKLKSHGKKFDLEVYSWLSSGPRPGSMAEVKKVIFIGHSFGGNAALKRAHAWNEVTDPPIDLLVTLDPRQFPFGAPMGGIFQTPPIEYCRKHVNFYQTTPLVGYRVARAENIQVAPGHTAVPARNEVLKLLLEHV